MDFSVERRLGGSINNSIWVDHLATLGELRLNNSVPEHLGNCVCADTKQGFQCSRRTTKKREKVNSGCESFIHFFIKQD